MTRNANKYDVQLEILQVHEHAVTRVYGAPVHM